LMGVFEEFGRADCGTGFPPVGLERSDDREMRKAKVGHGPRRRADVERVAWGNEYDIHALTLVELETLWRQGMIVLRMEDWMLS